MMTLSMSVAFTNNGFISPGSNLINRASLGNVSVVLLVAGVQKRIESHWVVLGSG